MRQDTPVLDELIEMSLWLAEPSRECVILGEGNTSAQADAETFYVKASGAQLVHSTADSFVQVYSEPLVGLLEGPNLDDTQIKDALAAACVNDDGRRRDGNGIPRVAAGPSGDQLRRAHAPDSGELASLLDELDGAVVAPALPR